MLPSAPSNLFGDAVQTMWKAMRDGEGPRDKALGEMLSIESLKSGLCDANRAKWMSCAHRTRVGTSLRNLRATQSVQSDLLVTPSLNDFLQQRLGRKGTRWSRRSVAHQKSSVAPRSGD